MSQMKPYCFNCGAELDPDAIHCPACGRLQRSIVVRNVEDHGAGEGDSGSGQAYQEPDQQQFYQAPAEDGYQDHYQPPSGQEQNYFAAGQEPYYPDQGERSYYTEGQQYYQPRTEPAAPPEEAPYFQAERTYGDYPRYEPPASPADEDQQKAADAYDSGQPSYYQPSSYEEPGRGYETYPQYGSPAPPAEERRQPDPSGRGPGTPIQPRSAYPRQPTQQSGQPVYSSPFTASEPQPAPGYESPWEPDTGQPRGGPAHAGPSPSPARPDPYAYSSAYGPPPQAPEAPNWARRIAIGVAGLFCLFVIGFALNHLMGHSTPTASTNNPNFAPTPPTRTVTSPTTAGGATPSPQASSTPSPGATPSPQASLSGDAVWQLKHADFLNDGRCTTSQGCGLEGTFDDTGGQGVGQATFNLTDQSGSTVYASCSVPLDSSQGNEVSVSCYANSPQLDQLFLSNPNASVYLHVQVQNPSG